jgi:hypothetical protein
MGRLRDACDRDHAAMLDAAMVQRADAAFVNKLIARDNAMVRSNR